MEVLSAAQYPVHTTSQSLPHTRPQRLATVSQQQQSQQQHHNHHEHSKLPAAPTSQESIISAYSVDSSDPYSLHTSTSDLSQHTALTEASTAASNASTKPRIQTEQPVLQRAQTPPEDDYALTSPMSITSPTFANGAAKRTASGHVKNAASLTSVAPYNDVTVGNHNFNTTSPSSRARAESMSSTGSRVGDLAASLKMRLGYAMTKVQHGWENKTIVELERMTTTNQSSTTANNGHVNQYHYHQQPTDTAAMSPPPKRRSGMFGIAATFQANGTPRLQPSVDIRSPSSSSSSRRRHHQHTRSADLRSLPLAANHHSNSNSLAGFASSPPQTPVTSFPRRPPTIRTDTQTAEAEREALQALTQLGSPHNSQYSRHHNVSQANSSQASPLRSEFNNIHKRRVSLARGNSDSSSGSLLLETSSEDGLAVKSA